MQTVRKYILLALMLCIGVCSYSQERDFEVGIAFRQGKSNIDLTYKDNEANLNQIIHLLDSITGDKSIILHRVEFSGAVSPEGSAKINQALSHCRLTELEKYVRARISLPDSIIVRNDHYIAWHELMAKVEASDMAHKDEVLKVLNNNDFVEAVDINGNAVDGRIPALKAIADGEAWKTMFDRFFSEMRNAYMLGFTYKARTEPSIRIVAEVAPRHSIPQLELEPVVEKQNPRHLYLKTNVIGLGMAIANLAVEVDLGKMWSVQLPIYYSGVDYFRSTRKFRTLSVQPEARFWFWGNANDKLFLGAHAAVSYYNFAWDGKYRVQDEDGKHPALGGGLTLGYRLPISRNQRWKMEFSVGAGVYDLKYDKFFNTDKTWKGELSHTVHETWIGIDHVGVSFSYMFNLKRKNK